MSTFHKSNGFRFYVYANEGNEPPHVHADKGGGTMKVWLLDLSIAETEGLKPAEIRAGLRIISEKQTEFLTKWNEFDARKS